MLRVLRVPTLRTKAPWACRFYGTKHQVIDLQINLKRSFSLPYIQQVASEAQEQLNVRLQFDPPHLTHETLDRRQLLTIVSKIYAASNHVNPDLDVNVLFPFSKHPSPNSHHIEAPEIPEAERLPLPLSAQPNETHAAVILGGTFDRLHPGHKLLLTAAVLVSQYELFVGTMDDSLLKHKKNADLIQPLATRKRVVSKFVHLLNPRLQVDVFTLFDNNGPTVTNRWLNALVVSTETGSPAREINQIRQDKQWHQLSIVEVDVIEDTAGGPKISSSTLRQRELEKRNKAQLEKEQN